MAMERDFKMDACRSKYHKKAKERREYVKAMTVAIMPVVFILLARFDTGAKASAT